MSVIELPNGRFRVQIRRAGFPKFDKVFATKSAAAEAEAKVLGEQVAITKTSDITLSEAWLRYSVSQTFLQKKDRTRDTETQRIKAVLEELGDYSLLNLQDAPGAIYDYIDKRSAHISVRTKKKLSSTSVRLEVAALSSVVAWAKQRRLILGNFVRQIDRPPQAKRRRRVDGVEVAGLREASEKDDNRIAEAARFFLLLRYLGCRPGELARLLREDISWEFEETVFRDTKYKNEERRVHLTGPALQILDAQMRYAITSNRDSIYLFTTLSKDSVPDVPKYVVYNYEYAVKLMRKANYVEKTFHAHAMRREFISKAIENGLPYSTIRKQTGHHSTQAIEIYDEGLSTAPEIRQALDLHALAIGRDESIGAVRKLDVSTEEIEAFKFFISGEYGKAVSEMEKLAKSDYDGNVLENENEFSGE